MKKHKENVRAHLVSKGEPTNSAAGALPASLVLCVVALSLIPLFLLWIGVDLSTPIHPPDSAALADPAARTEALHDSLQGSILHILLEWSGVLVACFTIILALVYVRETHDDVTIIIALALFASACIDAFHVLAASYVFDSASDSTNFIPLTWVIARMFHVGVIAVGISLLLVRARPTGGPRRRRFVPLVGLGFAATAYGIVHLCATVPILPQMMFPDAVVKRPWDLVPLVLCCLVGLFLMPTFHRRYRSSFSQALWLAMLPDIVTEILMTFGSTSLYDGAFHLGHFTKLVAYAVPLAGLIVDYSRTAAASRAATSGWPSSLTSWRTGPRSSSAPTPTSSSSPTSPRTTCRSRCAWSRATHSSWNGVSSRSSTRRLASTCATSWTAPSACSR